MFCVLPFSSWTFNMSNSIFLNSLIGGNLILIFINLVLALSLLGLNVYSVVDLIKRKKALNIERDNLEAEKEEFNTYRATWEDYYDTKN